MVLLVSVHTQEICQRHHFVNPLLFCCARKTASSGEGPLNGSSVADELSISLTAMVFIALIEDGLVESVRPNAVGDARRSGTSSIGSCGGGVGSLGGGAGSDFFLIGYFFGSDLVCGFTFSFVSFGLLSLSRELNAPSGAGADMGEVAAFFRLSSASLASFEEPPNSLGRGMEGSTGTIWPSISGGTLDQGTP